MRDTQLGARREESGMKTRKGISFAFLLSVTALLLTLAFMPGTARAQNVQVDLTTTCNSGSCFNWAGIFNTGTTFVGTPGMDNGQNCSSVTPCPDSESAQQLGLSTTTPPTLTPTSLNIPFTFGPVNTANCGPATSNPSCTDDVINIPTGPGTTITLPSSQQVVYSTLIMLGTSVNGFHGQHSGTVSFNYTTGAPQTFSQNYSEWCSFQNNPQESIAVGGINRLNADGTLNGASCNLYAYTYALDFTRVLQSITLSETDTLNETYMMAMTLKPPTYTLDAGVANPTSVAAGSTSTATITINPQPGYGSPTQTVTLSCAILPTIATSGAATAPTCSLSPSSVTVSAGETSLPTSTLTFTAAAPTKAMTQTHPGMFYAMWLPIPGLALVGLGLGRNSRRKRLLGLMLLGLLLAGLIATPACVSYTHLGNVGTPPGQYTISVTGIDTNNLSQASNPTGTTNTVTVTVTDN